MNIALHAQPVLPDSVRSLLKNGLTDTSLIKRFINAVDIIPYNYPDSGLYFSDSIIRVAETNDYEYGRAAGYFLKAGSYAYSGDYSKAMLYYFRSLRMKEATGNLLELSQIYQGIAYVYSQLGNHKKALEYLLKARAALILLGDSTYHRTDGQIHPTAGNISMNNYLIAAAYLEMGMTDSALKYNKPAFAFNANSWPSTPRLMGDIYFMRGDYHAALAYYNINTQIKLPLENVQNIIGKANTYNKMSKPDSFRLFAEQALDTARKIDYTKGIMQASELLSQVYERTDLQKSLSYLRLSLSVKDSLYSKERVNQVNSIAFGDELQRLDAEAAEKAIRNRYKIIMLASGLLILLIAGSLLWRSNVHRKQANNLLKKEKQTVETTLEKLKATQAQLIQSEKMASLGELTAGIAHEIQNPLNFVNNFSEVNIELLNEMEDAILKSDREEIIAISTDFKQNLEKINYHGKRADAIVKNMLQHSRSSSSQKDPTDINKLADEYLRLSYHGMRAKDKEFNATIQTDFDETIGKINIIPQDIGRVLLNLYNNAFYALAEKKKNPYPLKAQQEYEPTISVNIKAVKSPSGVLISVKDNGNGIPQKVLDKIFQPFFTTKPTGQGTGLGLSLSYDIIKAHGGEINVKTDENKGTEFIITIPSQS